MVQTECFHHKVIAAIIAAVVISNSAFLASAEERESRSGLRQPVYRVEQPIAKVARAALAARPEHPLAPAIQRAMEGFEHINANIRDYTCTLIKRERVGGKLTDYEYMFAKIRHEHDDGVEKVPFSVYMYFVKPDSVKSREVLYVEGQNNNKLVAHEGGNGFGSSLINRITVDLAPTSRMAMRGNRYPITDIGIQNLVKKLIEVAEEDMKHGDCIVKIRQGAKVNKRICTCIEVVHPERNKNYRFHKARIFIDDELNVPIRYAAWDWPAKKGGQPRLLEEYTYVNVKLNVGLTATDFDRNNPKYRF